MRVLREWPEDNSGMGRGDASGSVRNLWGSGFAFTRKAVLNFSDGFVVIIAASSERESTAGRIGAGFYRKLVRHAVRL